MTSVPTVETPAAAIRSAALVQGAGRGIGLALLQRLLADESYSKLVATCRDPQRSDALQRIVRAHPDRVFALSMDVTDESSVSGAADQLTATVDKLSLLINCAGVLHDGPMQPERRLADVDPCYMQRAYAVNALGPLLVAKHFARFLESNARSVVANLSARVGSIGDNRRGGWYGYRASKAALNMLTRNLAIELRRTRPDVICIALHPGTVDTALSRPFQTAVPAAQLFSTDHCAARLLGVIANLESEDNGRFIAWDGSDIPW